MRSVTMTLGTILNGLYSLCGTLTLINFGVLSRVFWDPHIPHTLCAHTPDTSLLSWPPSAIALAHTFHFTDSMMIFGV